MAASITSSLSSTFSSLSLRRFSLPPPTLKPNSLSFPTPKPLRFRPIKAKNSPDDEIVFFPEEDRRGNYKFDPPEDPQEPMDFISIDELFNNKEVEIEEDFEEEQGDDYYAKDEDVEDWLSDEDEDEEEEEDEQEVVDVDEEEFDFDEDDLDRRMSRKKYDDDIEDAMVEVRRVTKVVKGGKQLHFRALVVVGDKRGTVGVGVAQALEVDEAVEKSVIDARKKLIKVPLTKSLTFPHRQDGKHGAAKVMLRPAAPGTGINAGGAVRVVLEMAGVENALGKQLGSDNAINNARATLDAILRMRTYKQVAAERGIPMEELWK